MVGVLIFIAPLIAIIFGYKFLLPNFKVRSPPKSLPPGSLGLPIIGDTLNYLRALKRNNPWGFFEQKKARYGPVYKLSLIGTKVIVLPAPVGNKLIFTSEDKLVRNNLPPGFRRLLGPGSLTAKSGEDFRRLKKVFMAFLKPEALQRYVPKVSKLTVDHLGERWEGKSTQVVYPTMKAFIFSIMCSMFMSLEIQEEQQQLEEHFTTWSKGLVQLPLNVPGTMFYKALRSREVIHRLLDELIRRRKKALDQGSVSEVSDILSVMLSSKECSVEEIKDNLLLLLFAGHDTTTATLTVALKFLCDHPFWKNQVLQENLAIANAKERDYKLEWEDLKRMKVTWKVLQETLRLQPPAAGAYREVIQDFEFNGFTIPKGWKVYWSTASHREDEFFEDPTKFDPSRFEAESPAPFTFVPFGGGPRMCPGNEFARMVMLVFMHYLVMRFKWELEDPAEEIIMDPVPTLRNGLRVTIDAR